MSFGNSEDVFDVNFIHNLVVNNFVDVRIIKAQFYSDEVIENSLLQTGICFEEFIKVFLGDLLFNELERILICYRNWVIQVFLGVLVYDCYYLFNDSEIATIDNYKLLRFFELKYETEEGVGDTLDLIEINFVVIRNWKFFFFIVNSIYDLYVFLEYFLWDDEEFQVSSKDLQTCAINALFETVGNPHV